MSSNFIHTKYLQIIMRPTAVHHIRTISSIFKLYSYKISSTYKHTKYLHIISYLFYFYNVVLQRVAEHHPMAPPPIKECPDHKQTMSAS